MGVSRHACMGWVVAGETGRVEVAGGGCGRSMGVLRGRVGARKREGSTETLGEGGRGAPGERES